jgi:DNA-directed RNA polymerase specialized sigma24 family protein
MMDAETTPSCDHDVAIIRACIRAPTQGVWDTFFRHFEHRFEDWIRTALRDGSDADRQDAYQNFARELLSGKILPKIDLSEHPDRYLHKCVLNLARRYHRSVVRHPREPLDENTIVPDRLRRLADQAQPVAEDELFQRLSSALHSGNLDKKQLATFSVLLEHKKLKDIAQLTGFSKSAVGRYVKKLEAESYAALGVPLAKRKRVPGRKKS